jgi:S1-C subfamily serine protease
VEVARRAKAATVLVDPFNRLAFPVSSVSRRYSGTVHSAFCVHPSGLFLTSYQAANGARNGLVTVIFQPGRKSEKVVPAWVVRTDPANDLALLSCRPDTKPCPALPLGSIKDLRAGTEIITCGYASGGSLLRLGFPGSTGSRVETSPNLAIQVNQLASSPAEVRAGAPPRMQQPAGTIGGPVLDRRGKVIGMSTSDRRDPLKLVSVERLREFLKEPVVVLHAPVLGPTNQHQPVHFQVSIVDCLGSAVPATTEVELLVQLPKGKERRYKLRKMKGIYHTSLVPVPAPKEEPRPRVAITYSQGRVEGKMPPQTIQLAGRAYPADQIRNLSTQEKRTRITLKDGHGLQTTPAKLPSLVVEVGGKPHTLSLKEALGVQVIPPEKVRAISCVVLARQGKTEVLRRQQVLPIILPDDPAGFRGSRGGFNRGGFGRRGGFNRGGAPGDSNGGPGRGGFGRGGEIPR